MTKFSIDIIRFAMTTSPYSQIENHPCISVHNKSITEIHEGNAGDMVARVLNVISVGLHNVTVLNGVQWELYDLAGQYVVLAGSSIVTAYPASLRRRIARYLPRGEAYKP
jgi:hypothetical protein